jgi:CubicO group peptidase (beta-lactamase class C family)
MPRRSSPTCSIRALAIVIAGGLLAAAPAHAQSAATLAEVDRVMEAYRLDAHIPGMVWGIVKDGRLVHVKGAGVQDIDAKRPVTADTLFRIASMTKAFTALSILWPGANLRRIQA